MASAKPFDRLLRAAAAQPEPPQLLFVFADGEPRAMTPLACVDKAPEELRSFDDLLGESPCRSARAVFIGALSGRDGERPVGERVEYALKAMAENIRTGRFAGYTVLDPSGAPLRLA